MRFPVSAEALALVSAALRHMRDAEHLATVSEPHRSLDQSFHLAGYAPECIRKATLSFRWMDKAIGHRFDASVEDLLELALSLDPEAHRYDPHDWAGRYPRLQDWTEQSRYGKTGTYTEPDVNALLVDARRAVDDVVLALWADGRLPDGSTSW